MNCIETEGANEQFDAWFLNTEKSYFFWADEPIWINMAAWSTINFPHIRPRLLAPFR